LLFIDFTPIKLRLIIWVYLYMYKFNKRFVC